jgi:hypothetical protein
MIFPYICQNEYDGNKCLLLICSKNVGFMVVFDSAKAKILAG